MSNLQNYWQKAISFDEYLKISEERANDNPDKNDEHQEYYELGLQRMNRILKTFKVDDSQLETLKSKNFTTDLSWILAP